MGLLKGTLTFSRYRTSGSLPHPSSDRIDESIKKYAFRDNFLSDHDKVMGWTGLESILDTSFAHAQYAIGDYLIFALRIDRKLMPPSLLKIKSMEREKAYCAEKGIKKIHREQREAIRETVRLELLEKIQPVPSFYDVCWSGSAGSVIFASLSEKVIQDFWDFFKQTFEVVLTPFSPWDTPCLAADTRERIADFEKKGAVSELSIGREFLTWLWFKSEERNGSIMIPNVADVEVTFARRMVLESGEGDYSETVVCRGLHADLKEGKEALRQGKQIKEARIMLERDSTKWEFTFKADRFSFQSLKLPAAESDAAEDDESGRILERIYLVEKAVDTMDRLFALFLQGRLSDTWESELARMAKWWRQGE